MATLSASAPSVPSALVAPRRRTLADLFVPVATALPLLAIAVLLCLPPFVLHPLLDAADSAAWLNATPAEAHQYSDETVDQLVFGPGTFEITGPGGAPLYDAAEASHMRDARALLYAFLGLALVCLLALAVAARRAGDRRRFWRGVGRGGAGLTVGVVVLGAVAIVAFEPAFELFHRIFFPGGNWSFDATTEHLVQLYPLDFWQDVSGVVGVIAAVLGAATWIIARRRAARIDARAVQP